jgi:hypothetical protein
MGDDGLRLLTPHISKSRVQCLTLDNCGLTDASLPFITSIMKACATYTLQYLCSCTALHYTALHCCTTLIIPLGSVAGSDAGQALLELYLASVSRRRWHTAEIPCVDDGGLPKQWFSHFGP